MSPEQRTNNYDYKVDIFSLGLILFEIMIPLNTDSEKVRVFTDLRNGIYPQDFKTKYPNEVSMKHIFLE